MSKINATYSSGYYIAPDVDFRKLEEAQRQEQRGKRKKAGADSADDGGDDNVKRQTFAIPFDLICQHCHHRIARGSHVYTNRRATEERYLDSIRVWELEILCRFCSGKYFLRTDPATPKETGGYICAAGCKRVEGDFFSLNKQNQAAREEWEKAKADAELDPLAALEKENEAARLLEERNRQIEEEVEQQAGYDDGDLLQMLRSRPRHHADLTVRLAESDEDDGVKDDDGTKKAKAASSSSTGLPPPPPPSSRSTHFDTDKDGDGKGGSGNAHDDEGDDEEDADERTFREFEQDMERRWRALERQQRAQQRKQEAAAQNPGAVQEDEMGRVLARYGGGTGGAGGASASTPSSLPSAKGIAGEAAPSSLVASAVVDAAPAVVLQHRNKFLVEEEDDDDDNDADERVTHAPQHRLSSHHFRTSSLSTAHSPSTGLVRVGPRPATFVAVPQLVQPRPGGKALLRNLVDSDSDDDA